VSGPVLVVLAAGASSRLGTPKALVRLGDEPNRTPLACLLAAGSALGNAAPVVVAGTDHDVIAMALAEVPGAASARLLLNPAWRAGRTGGLCLARDALPGEDLCVAPVDVPLVPRAVFSALARAWSEAGEPARGWLAPFVVQDGRRRHGHPVVIGRDLLAELDAREPDRPLRDLRAGADPLLGVEVASRAILDDLDRPEDLARLRPSDS